MTAASCRASSRTGARRGADARVHERGSAAAHAARPASCTCTAARARSSGTRARRPGNTQAVKALRYDCDADAVLALVEPAGPACHTGERTCFFTRRPRTAAPHEALPGLERTLRRARRPSPTEGSYTAKLLADPPFIGEKVQEEAEEVVRAAREESDERVAEEAADVLYHLDRAAQEPRAEPRRRRGGARWPPSLSTWRSSPTPRGGARRSPGDHNLIPVTHTFIEDCETPVSAFLKLRGDGPAFLLESAEQGQQVGRWSFIGWRPKQVVRWSLADGGDPYTLAQRGRRPSTARPRSPACRRSRAAPSASSASTACAPSSACPEPNPDVHRAAGHGADAHRRDRRLRPPAPHGHDPRQRLPRRRAPTSTPPTPAPSRRSARSAPGSPARCRALDDARPRDGADVRVQHDRASTSRPTSRGSSSTSTPATPTRWSRRQRWSAPTPGRAVLASTAACAP